MSKPDPTSDVHTAATIARAERRRAMLERLAEIGMALVEEIGARTVDAPLHPEPRHDPNKGYAVVSRAVRLTLAFEARMDADITSMRNGQPAPDRVPAPLCPRRARIRNAVWEAVNQEMRGLKEAGEVLDRLHESLIEREDYEHLLDRPWREAVAAICSDLGLAPDWSRWTDEEGFIRETTASGYSWQEFWTYSPERRRKAPSSLAKEKVGAADG